MKIINNKDPLIDARNQLCFLWESILLTVQTMGDMNDLYSINSHKYILDKESVDDLNSLVRRLDSFENRFLELLEKRNNNEIQEQYEFMEEYTSEILNRINETIDLFRNKQTKNRIQVTKLSLETLIKLKKQIEGFRSRFEFV